MERANFTGTCALVCLAISGGAVRAAEPAAGPPPEFSVRSLGSLSSGRPNVAGVNDRGSTIGSISTMVGSETRMDAFFRDRQGNQQLLGHLPGGRDMTTAWEINGNDWVVGQSSRDGPPRRFGPPPEVFRAIVWNPGDGLIELGSLGGDHSMAEGINDRNQVVGYSDTPGERRAFIWEQGIGMRALAVPDGSGTSTAHDINNKGTIAGHTYLDGQGMQHANLWTRDGTFVDLGDLPGGHVEAAAFAVNEKDHAVGYSIAEDDLHRAFFWSEETGMIDLGAAEGSTEGSVAHDINNDDWVVGRSRSPGTIGGDVPFLWTPEWGLLDLNDLLDPSHGDWKLQMATWVNDHGDIMAVATRDGEYHMVLLSPHTPEPGAAALALAGAGLLLRRTRKR